jgi:membrane protease YdiL (CAAX protease family)
MFSDLNGHCLMGKILPAPCGIEIEAWLLISRLLPQRYSIKAVAGSPYMHTYLRNKPAWLQLMIFGGLTFGLLLLASVVGGSILAHIYHMTLMQLGSISANDFGRPENAGIVKGLLIVNAIGVFILPSLVFSYLADPHPLAYLGIRPPQKNSFLLIGLVTMIAAYFAVEMLASLNESIVYLLPKSTQQWILKFETDANGQMKNILSMKSPVDLLMTLLLAGALPAISEELFFRGVLQKLFIQIFRSAWPGIIFTAFFILRIPYAIYGLHSTNGPGVILVRYIGTAEAFIHPCWVIYF